MNDVFCLIPARSGSKGIKNKNIKKIKNITLIEHAARFAKNLSIENILISSDSKKYEKIGLDCGCISNGIRPESLSKDMSSTKDVVKYEWKMLESLISQQFNYCLILEPTAPLRNLSVIKNLISVVCSKDNNYKSGFTAKKVEASNHPFKYFYFDKSTSSIMRAFSNEPSIPSSNRQEIDNNLLTKSGSAYITSKEEIMKNNRIISPYSYFEIELSKTINIDTYDDLYLAKKYFS